MDDEDLFGGFEPVIEERQSRSRKSRRRKVIKAEDGSDVENIMATDKVGEAMKGVTIAWLKTVFGMERKEIERRLTGLTPKGSMHTGALLYDIRDAAARLVEPHISEDVVLKALSEDMLPPSLSDKVWAARLKAQRWKLAAGELWPTDAVMDAFSDVFKLIKDTVQLWPDTAKKNTNLTDAQHASLTQMSDALLDEIHHKLVALEGVRATPSQLAVYDEETKV